MNEILLKYKNWQYKNIALLIVSLLLLFFFIDTPLIQNLIKSIGRLGYIGAFIVGIFFVSIFTVSPSAVILFNLAKELDPIAIAVIAGAGAVIGDYLIFRFVKDKLFEEIKPIFANNGFSKLIVRMFKTPFFSWLIPLIGAAIIASPLPDEIGISILGLSKVKNWQFILVTFILNSIGILLIVGVAQMYN